jgi:hypothetical protein
MNTPDFTAQRTNGQHPAATVAERHAAAYQPALTPHAPQRPARGNLGGKLPTWLITAVMGLLVGGAAMGWAAYQTMPIRATEVQRVFADVNGDGIADLIVSGWVIYAPKADGQ